jgi:Na+-transporting NADH:ubiquinone oxidoreductase subunit C
LLVILVCGVLLSTVSGMLAEKQQIERELERKKFILKSSLADEISGLTKLEIADVYADRVEEKILDQTGKEVLGKTVNQISLKKEYKKLDKKGILKKGEEINLPVYLVKNKDKSAIEFYVVPLYGFGLWDNIWGYAALKSDLNTVQGIVLDHKGETPGLGANITDAKIQLRYQSKQIFNTDGELVSVTMQKGEGNDYSSDPHSVDGMSGATITATGVNNMLMNYLRLYQPYIESTKQKK